MHRQFRLPADQDLLCSPACVRMIVGAFALFHAAGQFPDFLKAGVGMAMAHMRLVPRNFFQTAGRRMLMCGVRLVPGALLHAAGQLHHRGKAVVAMPVAVVLL